MTIILTKILFNKNFIFLDILSEVLNEKFETLEQTNNSTYYFQKSS